MQQSEFFHTVGLVLLFEKGGFNSGCVLIKLGVEYPSNLGSLLSNFVPVNLRWQIWIEIMIMFAPSKTRKQRGISTVAYVASLLILSVVLHNPSQLWKQQWRPFPKKRLNHRQVSSSGEQNIFQQPPILEAEPAVGIGKLLVVRTE
jgi:hypothetical protein